MIICQNCNFEVSHKMRHSIELNACPSCGKVLLNNLEIKRISSVRKKLSSQEFSKDMKDSLASDISFFIYFHIVKPMLEVDGVKEVAVKDGDKEIEPESDSDALDETPSQDLDSIREEVEKEVLDEGSLSVLDEDEVEGDRVSRLRNLARKQKMNSKNPLKVKRISS